MSVDVFFYENKMSKNNIFKLVISVAVSEYHRFGFYRAINPGVVCGDREACAQSAGMGIRSGLDDAIRSDGYCGVSYLEERARSQGCTDRSRHISRSAGPECVLVNHLFRSAFSGRRAYRDYFPLVINLRDHHRFC